MPDWFSDFASTRWWVSVVVVGIVINLVSRRLDERITKRAAGVSHWWAASAQRRLDARLKTVAQLRVDPVLRAYYMVSVATSAFVGLTLLLLGALAGMLSAAVRNDLLISPFPDWLGFAVAMVAWPLFLLTLLRVARKLDDMGWAALGPKSEAEKTES